MAGGKETPRQKMIGMMYLVLTALLALQVSSAIIDKFKFLNDSLEIANTKAADENQALLGAIKGAENTQRNKGFMDKADQIKQETAKTMAYLEGLKKELIEKTGGIDPESGNFKNPNAEADVEALMIGGNKNGKGYEMRTELNKFTDYLNQTSATLTKMDERIKVNIAPLAVEPKDIPSVKRDPVQSAKDFAEFNFGQTPLVAALATISQKQSEITRYETALLESISKIVEGQIIVADQFMAIAAPVSSVVAEGAEYEAKMFVASFSSSTTPTMTAGGNPVTVDKATGMGTVKFKTTPGAYDKNGQAKKEWVGQIRVPKPGGGDTLFTVKQEYTVVKPVIKVESKALKALYLGCANELIVSVPALGASYKPSFSGSGGAIIPGQNGQVTIVPTGTQVELVVSNNGSRIGSETFSVKGIPTPTLRFLGSSGAELNDRDGVSPNQANRITVKAEADENFKETNPNDARYKVTDFEVMIVRGRNPVGAPKRVTGTDVADISGLMAQAKPGDRIRIDVKQVSRMNYKGAIEPVRMKGSTLRNIPIN